MTPMTFCSVVGQWPPTLGFEWAAEAYTFDESYSRLSLGGPAYESSRNGSAETEGKSLARSENRPHGQKDTHGNDL